MVDQSFLKSVEVSLPGDLQVAFQETVSDGVGIVIVLQDSMFLSERKRIALLAAVAKLPTLFTFREFVEDGGLMSYGIEVGSNYHRAAFYVDRILKGEKPSELPFEFSTKLTLAINLQTAQAFGINVPPTLLARADEVIE